MFVSITCTSELLDEVQFFEVPWIYWCVVYESILGVDTPHCPSVHALVSSFSALLYHNVVYSAEFRQVCRTLHLREMWVAMWDIIYVGRGPDQPT